MNHRVVTVVLVIGQVSAILILAYAVQGRHLPGNQQGYEPTQPVAFSHRLHAGELGISCQYCHAAAEQSRHAGIPATGTCMNCHRVVTASLGAVQAEDKQAKEEKREPQPVVSKELEKV